MTNHNKLSRELFESMVQIKHLTEHMCEMSFEDHVTSVLQFQALRCLFMNAASTSSQLAEYLHISPSSMAQLAERLEKAQLITREQDTKDRRVVRISLTQKGREDLELLKEKMYDQLNTIFSCLSDKDMKELVRIHKVLLIALQQKVAQR